MPDTAVTGAATIPAEVVIRHTCHCKTGIQPPVDGEPDEHVFTVDGQDFPWPLPADQNPVVTRLGDDLYSIELDILLYDKDTHRYLSFGYTGPDRSAPQTPVLGGREFPWICTSDAYRLTFSHKMMPTLHLAFLARHVAGNLPIQDHRDGCAVYSGSGDLVADGAQKCFWCHELVDGDMLAHHEEEHPDRVRTHPNGHRQYRVS